MSHSVGSRRTPGVVQAAVQGEQREARKRRERLHAAALLHRQPREQVDRRLVPPGVRLRRRSLGRTALFGGSDRRQRQGEEERGRLHARFSVCDRTCRMSRCVKWRSSPAVITMQAQSGTRSAGLRTTENVDHHRPPLCEGLMNDDW